VRYGTIPWRKCLGIFLAVSIFTSIPIAAYASFTSSAQASQRVTTGSMTPPASAAVSMKCDDRFLFWVKPKVTVASYAPVPRANYYDIKLFDPSGNLQYTGDLSTATGKSYAADQYQWPGTWKYEIRANYKVPGSPNMWSSPPLTGTLNCP
jgi:hypothetical protein